MIAAKHAPSVPKVVSTMDPILHVDGVTKRFGGFTAVDNVNIAVRPGERFGLIGPNGSGKTTLINCIAGALRSDTGRVVFLGEDVTTVPAYQRTRRGIARSFQIPRPFKSMTVAENMLVAMDFARHDDGPTAASQDEEVATILVRMGLGPKRDTISSALSQVELRRLELARAMAARPRLLISDEAMAGLSNSEIDEILALLAALNGDGITVIMIEHIMHAVMQFSERIVCLDAGRIICEGTPAEVMANARVQEAYLGA